MNEDINLEDKREAERELLQSLDVDYLDPFPNEHGVLLSDKIDFLCKNHKLGPVYI